MNQPHLYSSNSDMQRRDSVAVLREYAPRLLWGRKWTDASESASGDEDVEASVLDVGCGTGDVTARQLLPLLPSRVRRVVGVDISHEMVSYARTAHRDPRLHFLQADISSQDFQETPLWKQEGQRGFSTVVSFYCFHWVQDHRTSLNNIRQLLRPSGEVLLVFLAKCPVFVVYEVMADKPQWKEYMSDYRSYTSPYQHAKDPAADFSSLSSDVGYDVQECRCIESTFTYKNMNCLIDSMMAVNPFIDRIPQNLKSQYTQDITDEIHNENLVTIEDSNGEQRVTFHYSLLVSHLQKGGK